MSRAAARLFGIIVLSCATAGAPAAYAQAHPIAEADYETLIQEASQAYGSRHFELARDLFEQAHAQKPSARTLRGLGIAAFALNRYGVARPELEAALVDSRKPLTREQRREVIDILGWMKESLGTARLELSPPHALALVDDQTVSQGTNLLELGSHRLFVRAAGYLTHEQTFVLERDQPLELRVTLEEVPPDVVPLPLPQPVAAIAPATPPPPDKLAPAATVPRDRGEPASTSTTVFERWWFWTLAAVVVAGGVGTVVAVTHEPDPRPYPRGTLVGTQ